MKYWNVTVAVLLFISCVQGVMAEDYLSEAKQYLAEGDVNSAVIQLKNTLQEDPANAEARFLLGRIYLDLEDGASAEKELKRARIKGADEDLWRLNLGQAYLLQGKFDEIIEEIESDPIPDGSVQASILALRGQAFLGKRNIEQAEQAFEQSLTLDPNQQKAAVGLVRVIFASGREEEGKAKLDELLVKYPDNLQALIMRGEYYRRSGQLESAFKDFDKALEIDPSNTQALLGRVVINLHQRQFEPAAEDLAKLEKVAPGSPIVLYLQGVYAFQRGNLEQAEARLHKVLELVPSHPQSQLLYGATKFALGEVVLADEYLTRALAALPGNLPAIKLTAAARIKMKQTDRAIEILEPAMVQHPDDAQLLAMLGNAYLQMGQFEQGSELLSRAVELSPDLATLRTQLAFGLLAQGNTGEAITELQSAVDLGQDLMQADILLVLSHLRNKEVEKALEASLALEKRMPDNPVPVNLSGLAYLASSDREKARAKFEKALVLDPKFVTAEINLARMEISSGQLKAAEGRFLSALDRDPGNLNAMIGMAALAEQSGDREKVYEWLEKAREANPESSKPGLLLTQAFLTDGDKLKALSAASELASNFPDQETVSRVLGTAQLTAGESNSAAVTFRRLAEKWPTAQNLTLLAGAELAVGNQDAARSNLQQALENQPGFLPAQVAMVRLDLSDRNYGDALTRAEQIQSDFPKLGIGYELAGLAFIAQNRFEAAIAAIAEAYRLQPTAKLAIDLARLQGARGDKGKSLVQVEDWLKNHPEDARTRVAYAMMLQGMGREDEAIVHYDRSLKGLPDNIAALNNLAWLYQVRGDRRAVDLAKRAYELAPRRPEVMDTYGWAMFNLGSPEKGLRMLQEALVLAPDHPEIGFHVGYALHKSGRDKEAERVLKSIIRETPDSPFAKQAQELLEDLK